MDWQLTPDAIKMFPALKDLTIATNKFDRAQMIRVIEHMIEDPHAPYNGAESGN